MPVQSTIERVGDDAVERVVVADARRLAHAVAQHLAAAELALVAVDGVVAFDFGDEVRVAEADAVARRRAEDVRRSGDRQMRMAHVEAFTVRGSTVHGSRSRFSNSRAKSLPPRMTPRARDRDERDGSRLAGLEAHGGAGRDVEAHAVGGAAVEVERAVRFDEVIVAADLDRTIAAVGDRRAATVLAALVRARCRQAHDVICAGRDRVRWPVVVPALPAVPPAPAGSCRRARAPDRRARRRSDGGPSRAWCRPETCLRPALRAISSGTPSITSARPSSWRPRSISSATERPSRMNSRICVAMSATASG